MASGRSLADRFGREAVLSLPWAAGVGIGVALGGWLTVASGSGSPGASSLDVGHDLVALPLLCAAVTFAGLVAVRLIVSVVSDRRASG